MLSFKFGNNRAKKFTIEGVGIVHISKSGGDGFQVCFDIPREIGIKQEDDLLQMEKLKNARLRYLTKLDGRGNK